MQQLQLLVQCPAIAGAEVTGKVQQGVVRLTQLQVNSRAGTGTGTGNGQISKRSAVTAAGAASEGL